MAIGYLTPDSTGTGTVCRSLFIPNDEKFIAIVTGALQSLTIPDNWQKDGALSEIEAADALVNMFDGFCFDVGRCRLIGEIIPFAGSTNPDPDRYLACDGSSYAVADYPDLYNVIGTSYGGITDDVFNVPDLRGRAPIGYGQGDGLTFRALAARDGEETHTLDTSEMPAHTHTDSGHVHSDGIAGPNATTIGPGAPQPTAVPAISVTGSGNASLSTEGDGGAHNNMSPWLAINYYIAVKP